MKSRKKLTEAQKKHKQNCAELKHNSELAKQSVIVSRSKKMAYDAELSRLRMEEKKGALVSKAIMNAQWNDALEEIKSELCPKCSNLIDKYKLEDES